MWKFYHSGLCFAIHGDFMLFKIDFKLSNKTYSYLKCCMTYKNRSNYFHSRSVCRNWNACKAYGRLNISKSFRQFKSNLARLLIKMGNQVRMERDKKGGVPM